MKDRWSRRSFLKITAATFAAAGLPGCRAWDAVAGGADPSDPRFGYGKDAEVVPSVCGMCFWKCGLLAHVVDGKVWKLTGNPADPMSRGRLCGRGTSGVGALYDPDRLRAPLVRTDGPGGQSFTPVSWDRAFDTAAEKLRGVIDQYGPESVAVLYHGLPGDWFAALGKAIGTPNLSKPSDAQCRGSRDVAFWLTYGTALGSPEPVDIENAKVMVLLGSHLGENMHMTQVREFSQLVTNQLDGKAKLVVADPRFSVAASKAWRYLPIRPATDLALLLAWMHVLLHEGNGRDLVDREYLEKYAYGLDQLTAHVKQYTPEWAYRETGIAPGAIREVALELAKNRPNVLIHPGRFQVRTGDDTQRVRAIAMLNALLGTWGRKGGFILADSPYIPEYPHPHPPKAERHAVDNGRFLITAKPPMQEIVRATLDEDPYPIKAWVVAATDVLQAMPDKQQTLKAMQKLDALIVVDVLPTEQTGYADVVLPECTYLERHDELIAKGFKPSYIALRQPVVEPLYQSKPGWWIMKGLAERLGVAETFPWTSAEELNDKRMALAGLDVAAAKRAGVTELPSGPLTIEEGRTPSFATNTGKIELYSTVLADAGGEALPVYRPPAPVEPGMFRLLFGRSPVHTFSRTTNNPLTHDLCPTNELWVNPKAARIAAVKDGQKVYLENKEGTRTAYPVAVRLTERVRPDCVYLIHGFGSQAKRLSRAFGKGVNLNEVITAVKVDPIMGGTAMGLTDVRLVEA